MKIHNVIQGTSEWLSLRMEHLTASEAPAMMGASKYMSRTQLLDLKKTGIAPEVDEHTQRRFDAGHETEAQCRAIIEKMIGEELFPIVATEIFDDLNLLASVDGANMLGDTLYEHKLWNAELADRVRAKNLDPHYYWQLEQQLLVTGAERVIFAVSDGTFENMEWMEYRAVGNRSAMLIAGWSQFLKDLETHQASVVAAPQAVATPIAELPSITYKLNGLALTSNLEEYRIAAERLVEDSKAELNSDQDFADAELRIKKFGEAEKKIALVCEQVVGEIKDVDKFVRDLGNISELIRQARLNNEKQVKSRKETIRTEIQQKAVAALTEHVNAINARNGVKMPVVTVDFTGVMKGKKTVKSLRDACDTELARAKIEASRVGDAIAVNLGTLRELASDHKFLFADVQQLVLKENADLINLIKQRIADHDAEQIRKRDEQVQREREAAAEIESEPIAEAHATPVASIPNTAAVSSGSEQRPAHVAQSIASVPITKPALNRPSDEQIIAAVAKSFGVHVNIARTWIAEINVKSAA